MEAKIKGEPGTDTQNDYRLKSKETARELNYQSGQYKFPITDSTMHHMQTYVPVDKASYNLMGGSKPHSSNKGSNFPAGSSLNYNGSARSFHQVNMYNQGKPKFFNHQQSKEQMHSSLDN
jgi:hypothetical protein